MSIDHWTGHSPMEFLAITLLLSLVVGFAGWIGYTIGERNGRRRPCHHGKILGELRKEYPEAMDLMTRRIRFTVTRSDKAGEAYIATKRLQYILNKPPTRKIQ